MNRLGIFYILMVMMMQSGNCQEVTQRSTVTTIKMPQGLYEVRDLKLSQTIRGVERSAKDILWTKLRRQEIVRSYILKNLNRRKRNVDFMASAFLKAEVIHKVPAVVLQAIAFIESSYIVASVNSKSNDYGIMQVNHYNVKAYKFNKLRLLTDIQYSINAGAEVFRWFYKRYPLEEAVMRYNCGTRPRCVKLKSVKQYLRKFKRAL